MKVTVYGSRVPGSKKVIGDQSRIFQILDGRKIEYTFIDVSLDEFSNDKRYLIHLMEGSCSIRVESLIFRKFLWTMSIKG